MLGKLGKLWKILGKDPGVLFGVASLVVGVADLALRHIAHRRELAEERKRKLTAAEREGSQ